MTCRHEPGGAIPLITNPFDTAVDAADGDTLHEECGVFGTWGSDGAAAMAALGLHALQHRGSRNRERMRLAGMELR